MTTPCPEKKKPSRVRAAALAAACCWSLCRGNRGNSRAGGTRTRKRPLPQRAGGAAATPVDHQISALSRCNLPAALALPGCRSFHTFVWPPADFPRAAPTPRASGDPQLPAEEVAPTEDIAKPPPLRRRRSVQRRRLLVTARSSPRLRRAPTSRVSPELQEKLQWRYLRLHATTEGKRSNEKGRRATSPTSSGEGRSSGVNSSASSSDSSTWMPAPASHENAEEGKTHAHKNFEKDGDDDGEGSRQRKGRLQRGQSDASWESKGHPPWKRCSRFVEALQHAAPTTWHMVA